MGGGLLLAVDAEECLLLACVVGDGIKRDIYITRTPLGEKSGNGTAYYAQQCER